MKSFIPWVGGKGKLLWLIHRLSPLRYSRFIDVFGGSGTVTLSRPIQRGCMEVYNDFNSDLTNLFCCVKNRTMALLRELGFLPLNSRDDFNVLYKFFSKEEFTDDYLKEELELTEVYLEPPEAEAIKRLMLERAPRGDIRRAADSCCNSIIPSCGRAHLRYHKSHQGVSSCHRSKTAGVGTRLPSSQCR